MANQQPQLPESQYPEKQGNHLQVAEMPDYQQDGVLHEGASWFFWVAGLTAVNSLIQLLGMDWGFLCSLTTTQIIDYIATVSESPIGVAIAVVADLFCIGLFVGMGILASMRMLWVFWVGIVLLLLDMVPYLFFEGGSQLIGIGFHLFIIYKLFATWKACR